MLGILIVCSYWGVSKELKYESLRDSLNNG